MKQLASNKELLKRILLTATMVAVTIWVWADKAIPAQPFCIFHRLTGIPCWGCGTTRVIRLLIQGKVIDAIMLNPLSVVACLMVVAGMTIWWIEYFCHKNILSSLTRKKLHPLVYVALAVIVLLNWIWNIYKGL